MTLPRRPAPHPSAQRRCSPMRQRGLSLVELMVGITVGLFILAAATLISTGQLSDNRRLMLEAQVQQDLRLATELIARDLRRAGYWGKAHNAVWPNDLNVALNNPYRAITPNNAAAADEVSFSRSQDEESANVIVDENNTVDAGESAGYKLNGNAHTIDVLLGGSWQALTDPAVLQVSNFSVTMVTTELPVPCGVECPALGPGGCQLRRAQRSAVISITANATHDPAVVRSSTTSVRLRNDVINCV